MSDIEDTKEELKRQILDLTDQLRSAKGIIFKYEEQIRIQYTEALEILDKRVDKLIAEIEILRRKNEHPEH